jgi:hypothetical protein
LFLGLGASTPYWYIVICLVPFSGGMALSMSPMTASIMSAVPERRAGMGSAMNDATRELGAALGVAVLGSIAASRYGARIASAVLGLSPGDAATAKSSVAGALKVADTLPTPGHAALTTSAQDAFLSGVHLAVTVGAGLSFLSAAIVFRFLPRSLAPQGALHGPLESLEDAAELGIAGVPPLFADRAP